MSATLNVELHGNAFCLSFSYDPALVAAVKSLPARRWDPANKSWIVPQTAAAELAALVARLDGVTYATGAEKALTDATAARGAALEASRATDWTGELPCPDGLAYLPYQRAGVAYAMSRAGTLIGDEMGLGKTIQAIGVSNADASVRAVLVICPASLKINWAREWARWTARPMTIGIANGKLPSTDVVVTNYDVLRKHKATIAARQWDLLICDECHYLKNPKAQRTTQVLGKWDKDPAKRIEPIAARRRLFLTGTPILNRPIELWPLLKALDPAGLGANWKTYVTRYCEGYQGSHGWDVSGASNGNELQDRMRASVMVRRLKADVLTELPRKRRAVVVLPDDGAGNVIRAEAEGYARAHASTEAARVAVELAKAGSDDDYAAAVERLHSATQAAFAEISALRHATALAKVPQVIEHVAGALEASGKLVLFAHHLDVIAALADALPGCVTLTGEHSQEQRQAAVDRFQNDASCRVFVGSIKAAGVGLTLTAASHVIFAELDWVPGNITQAEDRCHRIGQTDSVLIEHLVLDGSLDVSMAETLVDKQAVIDAALDDVERAELARIAVAPAGASTQSKSRAKIAEAAAKLSPDEIAQIHADLRRIAGMCDGAQELDGHGFNKIDTRIGHALAEAASLTPKQAALGAVLTREYRRQLGTRA